MTDDPYLDAADMDVTVENGEVTLAGRVDSRHAKRHAEVASCVKHAQNNLHVDDRSLSSADDATSTTSMFTRTAAQQR